MIYVHNGGTWVQIDGRAHDVAMCGDGTKWVIGTNAEGGGYGIYKQSRYSMKVWQKIPGSAVRIACGRGSNDAYVVNNGGKIF